MACDSAALLACSLFAETRVWTSGNGNRSNPANWQGNAKPMSGNVVIIRNPGDTPITVNNDTAGLSLQAVCFDGAHFALEFCLFNCRLHSAAGWCMVSRWFRSRAVKRLGFFMRL